MTKIKVNSLFKKLYVKDSRTRQNFISMLDSLLEDEIITTGQYKTWKRGSYVKGWTTRMEN